MRYFTWLFLAFAAALTLSACTMAGVMPTGVAPTAEATRAAEAPFPSTPTRVTPTATIAPTLTAGRPPATATPVATQPTAAPTPAPTLAAAKSELLVVTNALTRTISFIESTKGIVATLEVGAAPWGLAAGAGDRLYVSTAEGIAVVDAQARRRIALVAYRAEIGPVRYGEYRPGGMGIAAAADGRRVYVGVHVPGGRDQLEVLDTEKLEVIGAAPIGVRPFEVLVSRDGREVYTLDHDSYSVTAVDTATLKTRRIEAAPLGKGAFDKPHYAALDQRGQLWMPYQGKLLARLDPATGQLTTFPLTADTHQHGVTFTPDGKRLLIIGTGQAGSANGEPSLTIVDMATMRDQVIPLRRPHERLAVSADGRTAYLTGGYLLGGGWDGLTLVDLETRMTTELPAAGYPQDVIVLRPAAEQARLDRDLIAAAQVGDVQAVERLLTQGASVHARDANRKTALIAAAYRNHLAVAQRLIEAGADVNAQDNTRQSAYLIATSEGFLELLRLTLAAGADVRSLDSYNGTGLIRAADRGHAEIIAELLKTPINVNHINRLGWTALLEAIILGNGSARYIESVRLLVQAGADVNLADGNGVTPLVHARQRGFSEIVRILEGAGAR